PLGSSTILTIGRLLDREADLAYQVSSRVACNNKGNAVLQPRHTAQDSSGSDSAVATTSVEPPGASAYLPDLTRLPRQHGRWVWARNGPVHLQTVRRLICIGVGLALLADPRWHRRRQAASLDT